MPDKPHRRLSVLGGTPPASGPSSTPEPAPNKADNISFTPPAALAPTVAKLMVYFDPAEKDQLDELHFRTKKRHPRVSQSDVMRAALLVLLDHPEELDSALAHLPNSTESRQRTSKKG